MGATSFWRWTERKAAYGIALFWLASIMLVLPAATRPVQDPDGAALYKQYCKSCHGADGVPPATMSRLYPELKPLDAAFLATLTTDSIVAGLRNGIGKMKPYKDKLSDAQMLAVAKFVKTLGSPAATP